MLTSPPLALQDIVVGNADEPNLIYLNPGGDREGDFSTVTPIAIGTETDDTRSVVVADVDGDGSLDVVVGNGPGVPSKVYLNPGSVNGFETVEPTSVGSETADTRSVVVADVDGDGIVDLVLGNSGEKNTVYFGTGGGDYSGVAPVGIGTETDDTRSVVVADVNDDGSLDFIVGNHDSEDRVYLSDPAKPRDPVSLPSTTIGTEVDETVKVEVRDMNSDGLPDVVTTDSQQKSTVFLNDGTGAFPIKCIDRCVPE